MSKNKIWIAVATFNRPKIAEISLKQLNEYKKGNVIHITDDNSNQYNAREFFFSYADEIEVNSNNLGIHKLRCNQFRDFLENRNEEFIYMTDSDTLHDPNYINQLLFLMNKYNLPACLYNTRHHFNSTLKDNGNEILRASMPGVSQFFHREHVKIIVNYLNKMGDPVYAWDYRVVEALKSPVVTSKISYVDHFGGEGSIHNKTLEQDKAYNPTSFLNKNRKQVEEYLLNNKNLKF